MLMHTGQKINVFEEARFAKGMGVVFTPSPFAPRATGACVVNPCGNG